MMKAVLWEDRFGCVDRMDWVGAEKRLRGQFGRLLEQQVRKDDVLS